MCSISDFLWLKNWIPILFIISNFPVSYTKRMFYNKTQRQESKFQNRCEFLQEAL